MKQFIILMLCIILTGVLNAQSINTDSLWSVWNNKNLEKDDRLRAMKNIVTEVYLFSDPDSTFILSEKALQFSAETNDSNWMTRFSSFMGISLAMRGNNEEALNYFIKALNWGSTSKDPVVHATNLANLSHVYTDMGNFHEAIKLNIDALQTFEKADDVENILSSDIAIGILYSKVNDYENAKDYFLKALELNQKYDFDNSAGIIYQNLGSIYLKTNEYEKALESFYESLKVKQQSNYLIGIPTTLSSIGITLMKLRKLEEAEDVLNEALLKSKEIESRNSECTALINLSKIQLERRKLNKALRLANEAYKLSNEIGTISQIGDAADLLYQIHKSIGNKNKALGYYEQSIGIRDTINNEKNNRELIQQQYRYDYEKKEALAKLEQEKKDSIAAARLQKQKTIRNAFIAGFVLMLLSAIVFFKQRNRIKKEKAVSEKLLLNILPYEVAEELKIKGSADAKLFDQVTVLFTDFKQFTKISENLSPSDLVAEIHTCFQEFDKIMEKYNIEKIKTIGDAYMAAGGLPVPNSANAIDVVNAALEIRDFILNHIQEYSTIGKETFEIRIGVHSGPVVAGIVGIKKFQYDIWGDTVNTANRMESNGEVGKVNISGVTYELVKDHFNCHYRGKIDAKNKGALDMYFVGGPK